MSEKLEKETLDIPAEHLVPVMVEQLKSGKTVRFFPHGTSMLPMLRQGRDSVTLTKIDRPLKRFDIAFYKRDNGQYVLHRVVGTKDGITCIGDNQFYYEKDLRSDQMIAVVCEFSRGGKTVSLSSYRYRAYCVLWHISRPFRFFCFRVLRKIKRIIRKV